MNLNALTIGRIVHYHVNDAVTCPAMVTAISPDGKHSLTVFPPGAAPYPAQAEEKTEDNWVERWFWPTYEVDRAATFEAISAPPELLPGFPTSAPSNGTLTDTAGNPNVQATGDTTALTETQESSTTGGLEDGATTSGPNRVVVETSDDASGP